MNKIYSRLAFTNLKNNKNIIIINTNTTAAISNVKACKLTITIPENTTTINDHGTNESTIAATNNISWLSSISKYPI